MDNFENIWQIAKYLFNLGVKSFFIEIAKIKDSFNSLITTSKIIANIILKKNFLLNWPWLFLIINSFSIETSYIKELLRILFILEKVYTIIFQIFAFKKPSENGLSALV